MKWYRFNIERFIVDYLGSLFGSNRWKRWIYSLLYPLITLWDDYDKWRRRRFYLINITAQIISLEGFLNDEFDSTERRIYIISIPEGVDGRFIALGAEELPFLLAPLRSDQQEELAPFIGSSADVNVSFNFIVSVPDTLIEKENQVVAAIKNYQLAGKRFIVKYFSL